jgi:transcriptional regulator with XRE-family HTH domain
MISSIGMERPGHAIEGLRIEWGLTQAQACAMAGVPRATWSKVESGLTAHPQPDTKIRIARALGVRPSRIWPPRPRPLHLEDVDDERWERAVRSMARRLDRDGSFEERRRFGRRLIAVLDHADPGFSDGDDDRWEEFWRLGNSLMFDPQEAPIALVNGRLVERELDSFTPATRVRVVAAGPSRTPAGNGGAATRP